MNEKEKFFIDRTNKHIKLVQNAAEKIAQTGIVDGVSLMTQVANHDASKLVEPERTPYIELTWNKFKGIKDTDPMTHEATIHHIVNNSHHPEHWNKTEVNLDKEDRDKSNKVLNATKMDSLAMAEMVADWQAMAEELGTNSARDWYTKQKDVRWHFSQEQEILIDKLLSVFEKEMAMDNNLLLARTLYNWTLTSKTSFIESNEKLQAKLNALGLSFPNPDLALFETIYAELDVQNRNGVTLPKDVAEKGLSTLIGKNINFEHEGAGKICGFIIDARIENNFIIVDGVLFKSVWREEFQKVQKYFEEGKLHVSFELWNQENGASVVSEQKDGSKIVNKMIAHGCGLLMEQKPACPNATVTKLMASDKIIEEAEKIVDPVFHKDDKLVYAELCIKEECKHCANCTYERRTNIMEFEDTEVIELAEDFQLTDEDIKLLEDEEDVYDVASQIEDVAKLSYEKRQNLKDSDFALVIKKGDKTIRKYPIHDVAHVRNALARLGQEAAKATLKKLGVSVESVLKKVQSRAKKFGIETAMEEVSLPAPILCKNCSQALGEGQQESEFCPNCVVFEQEFAKFSEVLEEAAIPSEVLKRIKELHKEGKSMKEAMKIAWKEHKEKAAELEQAHLSTMQHCSGCGDVLAEGKEGTLCAMCQLKHDHSHLQEAYDVAMKENIAHQERYNQLSEEHKKLQEEHQKMLVENAKVIELKDKELSTSKEELGKKDQEIADLKIEKAKAETTEGKPCLTVGSVAPTVEEYKAMQSKINKKAFGHE